MNALKKTLRPPVNEKPTDGPTGDAYNGETHDAHGVRNLAPIHWDVPIIFGTMLVLSVVELGFCADTFQYKHRTASWKSSTERSRIAFLIFSSVRTIALAAVYIGFHFARKLFRNMHHTIFVVLSAIFWVVSGVLIHTLFGLIECGGVGSAANGKISECHELKIIEALSWALAALSVLAAIPVITRAVHEHKERRARAPAGTKRGHFWNGGSEKV